VPLPEVGVHIEPLAIEPGTDGRLLVDLVATGLDPEHGPDERLPIIYEGDRWLGELTTDGDWEATPIDTSEGTRWRAMAAATSQGAWFPLGEGGADCSGVALLGSGRQRHYLTDKCVYSLAAAQDGRVWVIASDHGGYDDIDEPQLYVITPLDEVGEATDEDGGT
jgi:hypothetical protein